MTEREPGVQRLYPSIFGKLATRYYCLRQLRQAIEDVIQEFVARDSKKLTVADYGCGGRPYESLIAPFVHKYIGIDLAGNKLADILISPEGQIELRHADELLSIGGRRTADEGAQAWNPVFDVTPAELIDAIVTERGVIERPNAMAMQAVFGR